MSHRKIICGLAGILFAADLDAVTIPVTNTNDTGLGSLRQAITDSNASAGVLDTITFNIPVSGVQTITPVSVLPTITDPVIIDGYTQPGASPNSLAVGNNAVLLIELKGPTNTGSAIGLRITAGNSIVRGLVINGGFGAGIGLVTNGGNNVEGCFIGTDPSGTAANANNSGVQISNGSSGNLIGGTSAAARNVISGGGSGSGISIGGGSFTSGSTIQNNYIGTDKTGTVKLPFQIGIQSSANKPTQIGGTTAGAGNVISGNNTGIQLQSIDNKIEGNYIGTDATGTVALGNTLFGISIVNQGNNTVGGASAASRNIISANSIGISINAADNCFIQGNYIGTDVTGTVALGNTLYGINFANNVQNTLIGGLTDTPGQPPGNVISGGPGSGTANSGVGIFGGGGAAGADNSAGTLIQGNLIGTDGTGTVALGNRGGIRMSDTGVVIGGADPRARNVISGNTGPNTLDFAVNIAADNTTLQGNFIGTDVSGGGPLGNGSNGVICNASNVVVQQNIIAFNNGSGLRVSGGTNNRISSNSIAYNRKRGIDLAKGGETDGTPTPNDVGDGDTGPNNLQNFPLITSVTNDGTNTTIAGTLNSLANTTFAIEFFSNSIRDASGFGQGENFLGATDVTTDGNGDANFNIAFPQGSDGLWFTATATDPSGNTSEFAGSVATVGPVILNTTALTARNGQPFRFRVLTMGGNPTQRLSVTGLPPGLSANAETGVISGTPTADGAYDIETTVTDGPVITQSSLQIVIVSDPGLPVIISPSVASVPSGQPFSYKIEAPADTTPSDATTFSIAGPLPIGLTFDDATGIISGSLATAKQAHAGGDVPDVKALSGGVLLGLIQIFATNSHGTTTSPLAFLQLPPMAVNISTRLTVGTSERVLIGGFIIDGNAPKIVILRAIGPSLSGVLPGALQNPRLELRDGAGALLRENDDWRSDQEADIKETTIPPADDLESAVVALLDPGSYTAILRGANNSTGIGVVEAYDLGTASMDIESGAQLANISTRGFVSTGNDVMIGGIISANGSAQFLVRAIGPSLSGFGIQGALPNPTLELRSATGDLLSANDDWKTRPDGTNQQAEIEATTIPPTNDLESALVQTLAPGSYTAIVRGQGGTTGVAVVEVYRLP